MGKQHVYTSQLDAQNHMEKFQYDALKGTHNIDFDPQKIEIHLSGKKKTKNIRFGINHPIAWIQQEDGYTMISKDDNIINASCSDTCLYIIYFLCLQELSRRKMSLTKYSNKRNKSHKKSIIHCLFVLHWVILEAKKRNLY
jgi:hypothetical protein